MLRLATLGLLVSLHLPAAQQQILLVVLKGANALGYYSMDGQLIATVPVGQHPHELGISPDGKYAYTTDNGTMRVEHQGKGGNTVSIVDIAARKRIGVISTEKFRRPHGLDVDPRTGYLAVTTEAPDRVLLLDPGKKKLIRVFDPNGKTTHMVRFGPSKSGAEYAFASNSGMFTMTAVQLSTGAIKSIPTGERPEGAVLSPDGKELYVCNRESDSITVIDVSRQAAITEIKTGKGPVRIAATPDGRTLVYALMHDHKIELADVATRRPIAQIPVEGDPISLHLSPDGKLAFAAAEEKDTVFIISLAERKVIRQFQTAKGAAPDPVMQVTIP